MQPALGDRLEQHGKTVRGAGRLDALLGCVPREVETLDAVGEHRRVAGRSVELPFVHLAEMSLAGQSSKVPKEDQKEVILKVFTQFSRMAPEIQDGELIDGKLFHG